MVAVEVFDVGADQAHEEAGVEGVGGRGVDLEEVGEVLGGFAGGGGGRGGGVEDVDDEVAEFDAHHGGGLLYSLGGVVDVVERRTGMRCGRGARSEREIKRRRGNWFLWHPRQSAFLNSVYLEALQQLPNSALIHLLPDYNSFARPNSQACIIAASLRSRKRSRGLI